MITHEELMNQWAELLDRYLPKVVASYSCYKFSRLGWPVEGLWPNPQPTWVSMARDFTEAMDDLMYLDKGYEIDWKWRHKTREEAVAAAISSLDSLSRSWRFKRLLASEADSRRNDANVEVGGINVEETDFSAHSVVPGWVH